MFCLWIFPDSFLEGTSEWSAEEITDAWRIADKLRLFSNQLFCRFSLTFFLLFLDLIGPLMEQPEYNMLKRDRVEVEYAPLYRKFGTGLTIFSPLRRGILTGKYNSGVIPTDSRAHKEGSWFRDEIVNGKDMLERVAKLEGVAKKLGEGVTQGQLALAWTIKNEHVSSAIIGATNVKQIQENLAAVPLVAEITPEIQDEIEQILGNKPSSGPMRFA